MENKKFIICAFAYNYVWKSINLDWCNNKGFYTEDEFKINDFGCFKHVKVFDNLGEVESRINELYEKYKDKKIIFTIMIHEEKLRIS